MTLQAESQKTVPSPLLDLFIVDFSPVGIAQTLNFFPSENPSSGSVAFQGVTFTPWPVTISGLDKTTGGPLARPTMTISNVNGYISSLLPTYQDMVGVKVTRLRTFARFLDGEPGADPAACTKEAYYVDRKKSEGPAMVEFDLVSGLDVVNQQLPGRVMIANVCPWQYKSAECGWPGTDPTKWIKADGTPTTVPEEDNCSKQLTSGCKARFDSTPGSFAALPFGGFPALGRTSG